MVSPGLACAEATTYLLRDLLLLVERLNLDILRELLLLVDLHVKTELWIESSVSHPTPAKSTGEAGNARPPGWRRGT